MSNYNDFNNNQQNSQDGNTQNNNWQQEQQGSANTEQRSYTYQQQTPSYIPQNQYQQVTPPPHPDGSDWNQGAKKRTKKRGFGTGALVACTLSAALIGGLVGGMGGMAVGYQYAPTPEVVTITPVPTQAQEEKTPATYVSSGLSGQALSHAQIAEIVSPSVVGITTQTKTSVNTPFGAMESESPGAGSGVIISADGYIVTNNHVIEGATSIVVYLEDGTEYTATLVGRDSQTDIAVLKIEANNLPAAVLGNSNDLRVGDIAVAVGNPLGELQGTVTQGIISALNREVTFQNDDGTTSTMNLLQTDAAINKGNSGGALVNAQGQLIGIVNAKNQGVGIEGLGFAIPIDDVKEVIDDLMISGYVTGRPQVGIGTREVTEQISRQYNLPMGLYVAQVEEYSAAERAGIRVGDVITAFNGTEVTNIDEFNELKAQFKVGDSISLTINRQGEILELPLTLQESIPND